MVLEILELYVILPSFVGRQKSEASILQKNRQRANTNIFRTPIKPGSGPHLSIIGQIFTHYRAPSVFFFYFPVLLFLLMFPTFQLSIRRLLLKLDERSRSAAIAKQQNDERVSITDPLIFYAPCYCYRYQCCIYRLPLC